MKDGLVEEPRQPISAVAEEGRSAAAKTDGVQDRGKRSKRTERLRNLESELKRNLHAATTYKSLAASAASDDDDDDGDVAKSAADSEGYVLPPPLPRIIISGFSNFLINGIYEESHEKGQGSFRVLRHVDNEDLCLEWLNGERRHAFVPVCQWRHRQCQLL